jgi:uracil-DNA glycosylase
MSAPSAGWSEPQRTMLAAMGLGVWPAASSVAPKEVPLGGGEARAQLEPEAVAQPVLHAAADDLPTLSAAIQNCRACGLCESRRHAVAGIGAAASQWMVVGEAPGEQEDLVGEPFVGASGELLDAMLAAAGRQRGEQGQVFITNAVKCRPPGNRNPSLQELAACAPFLKAQLALVKPKLVLALGRFAAQSLLGSDAPIGKLRAQLQYLADGTPVVVSYHPSYLLRQPLEKARAWEDLCRAATLSEERLLR